jgi:hypothetical protein
MGGEEALAGLVEGLAVRDGHVLLSLPITGSLALPWDGCLKG